MKSHMAVAFSICVLPYSALSITGKDNWQTINSSDEVIVFHPVFAGAFGKKGLFNACATNEEFRSKTPVKICLGYQQILKTSEKGTFKDYICNAYESRNVVISRSYTKRECVKQDVNGECIEFDTVTSVYPTGFQLPVIDSIGESSNSLIFSKAYTVPACD